MCKGRVFVIFVLIALLSGFTAAYSGSGDIEGDGLGANFTWDPDLPIHSVTVHSTVISVDATLTPLRRPKAVAYD